MSLVKQNQIPKSTNKKSGARIKDLEFFFVRYCKNEKNGPTYINKKWRYKIIGDVSVKKSAKPKHRI